MLEGTNIGDCCWRRRERAGWSDWRYEPVVLIRVSHGIEALKHNPNYGYAAHCDRVMECQTEEDRRQHLSGTLNFTDFFGGQFIAPISHYV